MAVYRQSISDKTPHRGSSRRRSLRPFVLTMFTVLAVAIAVNSAPPQAQASTRPISDCPDLHVVVVPGTVDSSMGRDPHDQQGVLAPAMADVGRGLEPGTVQTTYVPYPADFGYTSGGTPYSQSVAVGVEATNRQVSDVYERCGDQTDIAIVGYSQGADIAHRVAVGIGNGNGPVPPDRIRGVYLISDPNRQAGSGLIPGAPGQSAPLNGSRIEASGTPVALGGGINTGANADFGALTGRVVSLCMTGDFACSIPEDAQVVRIIANVAEQIHIDTSAPAQIATDLATVVGTSAARTVAHVVTTPHWMWSSESLGAVIQKATDPFYSGPELTDISLLQAAVFLAEVPAAAEPKIRHDALAAVRENAGLLTIASYPDYWYPGPSHGSYFGRPADSSGRTGAQYVSQTLQQSATSDAPSRSVAPEPQPVTEPAAEPLPLPVVDDVETAVAVADTTFGATMQLPEVTDALTNEANNLAGGSAVQTQVRDVSAVIDTSAAQVDQVFDQVEKVAEPVRQIVTSPNPVADVIGSIGSEVDRT